MNESYEAYVKMAQSKTWVVIALPLILTYSISKKVNIGHLSEKKIHNKKTLDNKLDS